LTGIDEVIGDQMKLKILINNFLNEFSYGIEKNNEFERFREVIQLFVGFGNDYEH